MNGKKDVRKGSKGEIPLRIYDLEGFWRSLFVGAYTDTKHKKGSCGSLT